VRHSTIYATVERLRPARARASVHQSGRSAAATLRLSSSPQCRTSRAVIVLALASVEPASDKARLGGRLEDRDVLKVAGEAIQVWPGGLMPHPAVCQRLMAWTTPESTLSSHPSGRRRYKRSPPRVRPTPMDEPQGRTGQ